ncbi:uncharacterized protein LOC129963866 [Argiope bruennichi]|uniref:FAS-associated death domain protein like n=1 Tax=Argiope bruennichi TaxID=94029 RepID=A0A8T0ESW1_ARGBR|nr:uncharacterized protein LOC129963866 [Argiope bruennichi]XP_055934420.1 uncharacterized protein LOC129963866 [Argiope bruennichi]KAF8781375.1 FAS-associated death domain protein like [Argiope bruennichi]
MINCYPQYSILKSKIVEEAGHFFSLEQIKEYFAAVINSRRALSKVKSLMCIIRLLEERDVLNYRNVTCLEQLGDLLKNSKIKNLVHFYKKLYLYEEEQCICGIQSSFQPDPVPVSQQPDNHLFQNKNHMLNDLKDALKNISLRVGKVWPYLARELGIEEICIDRIRAEFPKNFERQAQAALHLWLSREKENASIERLDAALNGRHCLRHGLGTFLREPGFVPM